MPFFSVPAADVWNADDWQFLLVKSKAMLNNLTGLRFYIFSLRLYKFIQGFNGNFSVYAAWAYSYFQNNRCSS